MFSVFRCNSSFPKNSARVTPIRCEIIDDDKINEPTIIRHIKIHENKQEYCRQNTTFTFDQKANDKK